MLFFFTSMYGNEFYVVTFVGLPEFLWSRAGAAAASWLCGDRCGFEARQPSEQCASSFETRSSAQASQASISQASRTWPTGV